MKKASRSKSPVRTKTKDSETFTEKNARFYESLRRKKRKLPSWFGLLDNRLFTNFHSEDMRRANSQAGKFVSWVSEYDFKVKNVFLLFQDFDISGYGEQLRVVEKG